MMWEWVIIGLLAIAIPIFHEAGHYVSATNKGYTGSIKWRGLVTVIKPMPGPKDLIVITWSGIIAGFIPLIFMSVVGVKGFIVGTVLMFHYILWSCNSDLKIINKCYKALEE